MARHEGLRRDQEMRDYILREMAAEINAMTGYERSDRAKDQWETTKDGSERSDWAKGQQETKDGSKMKRSRNGRQGRQGEVSTEMSVIRL